ncbi:MAG TPA: T9SS type A sorting domain-containing protein [Flavobacteriales bacterium]|nr:T9SS type A sorting domain-containing protein [Flavobacteriales bacterium]
MRIITLILTLLGLTCLGANAQCPAGQLEVQIDVTTDGWGFEGYWELVPGGNPCGSGTIFAGGNTTQLGCSGGTATIGNGYANSTTISEGPWCLTENATYDIKSIDDYNDGGTKYTVKIESFPIYSFTAVGTIDNFSFINSLPPELDASMLTLETSAFMEIGSIDVIGDAENLGATAITSLDINYSIDSGPTVTDALTGLNIAPFTEYNFTHATPWVPTVGGDYTLKVWVSNVNGSAVDSVPANDMITKQITIVGQTPNIISSYTYTGNTFAYTEIGNSTDAISIPMDLDFHPNGELWVVNLGLWNGTGSSGGTTITFYKPGEVGQQSLYRKDSNSKHFMALPTGLAFSLNGNFATSPSVYDANDNGGSPFTGPALWSSDSSIYAQPSGGNGSHLDMLHMSPYAMGIANEKDNIFWVFDSESNDIVKYDFVDDHGPGNTEHGDGKVYRYEDIVVDRIDLTTACHLAFDDDKKWLYIVDAGSLRVIRLDITTGTVGGTPSFTNYDGLATYQKVSGATQEVVVSSGLVKPSGIAVIEDRMLVSDNSNGEIIIYDISAIPATEMTRLQTGSAGVMGLEIGPNGKIWYVNTPNNTVNRIDPDSILPQALAVTTTLTNATVGSCDGTATANVSGGITPYTYSWNSFPVQNGVTATGLCAGNYIITVIDANGTSITANVVIGEDPLSIYDMDAGNLISIYPNPSKGTFIVQISGAGNQIGKSEIVVTNILGKLVYKASVKGSYTTVDLSSAEDGVYFVSLQNQWGKTTRKIIVSH